MSPTVTQSETVATAAHNGKTSDAKSASNKTANGKAKTNGKARTNGKADWQIVWIAVDRIAPNPFQPRLAFDALEMQKLTASIRAKGVQQPIIVRTVQNQTAKTPTTKPEADKSTAKVNGSQSGSTPSRSDAIRYELVAGERRLRACKAAKKRWIPAIVRDDLSDAGAAELALLENVQRSNISIIEEARGYKRLMLEFRLKEERLSKKVGKSVSVIREMMKLLQLPGAVQALLFEKKLTAAHGHALLPLASFDKVCTAVAEYAAREKLTATSLSSTLLPNAKSLQKTGAVVELGYKTRFDWHSECGKCPFKAYVRSGYSSYCLLPDEWSKKQEAALVREREAEQEAARVLEAARRENNGVVEIEHLAPGSYKDLSFGEPPTGCSPSCPCYKETIDPDDPAKKRPVCLDPNRYKELVQAQREAEEQKRQVHYSAVWKSAKAKLLNDVAGGDIRRLVVLVALPILRSLYDENGYVQSWRQGVEEIASELEVPLLAGFVSAEDDGEAYAALDQAMREGLAPEKMFLLCACLMLAEEARTAIRFLRETPGLDFVLENKQHSLESGDSEPNDKDVPDKDAPDDDKGEPDGDEDEPDEESFDNAEAPDEDFAGREDLAGEEVDCEIVPSAAA